MEKEKSSNFQNLIKERWSPRAFDEKELDKKILKKFFESGKSVASSYNEQPWYFIVATKEDEHYQDLFDTLVEFNQSWVKTAPVLVVGLSKNHFSNNPKTNLHKKYDLGAFVTAGSLAILEDGYYVHQMAGFEPNQVTMKLKIDKEYEPTVMFVIGKMGDKENLPEEIKNQENPDSPRKGIEEFVYGKEWGTKYF